MTILPHITSIYASPWVAWVLFVLLVLIVLNPALRLNLLVGFQSMFSQSERVYTSHSRAWGSEICSHLFRLGVVAMGILLVLCPTQDIVFMMFMKILGIVFLVYLFQQMLLQLVGHVFLSRTHMDSALEQHGGIYTMTCVCVYPILIVLINLPTSGLAQILCCSLIVVFVVLLLWKSIRLFYKDILSVLYILLYILCLEILPLGVAFSLAAHTL